MTVAHILTEIQSLPRSDKLQLLGLLVQELEAEDPLLLEAGATYPIWSPEQAFEGAETLWQILQAEKTTQDQGHPAGSSPTPEALQGISLRSRALRAGARATRI
jgi:hypothetical protein